VVLHTVTLGRDFGTAVEIQTGIAPGDVVVLNPPASLATGGQVRLHEDVSRRRGVPCHEHPRGQLWKFNPQEVVR
jgi:hypothetical protein